LAKYTKPGALIEDLSERNFKKQNDFDKNELIERINGYDENQLKIIHNEVFEMYVNTKEVIGADGISVKDFMRASKRGQILLFQVENNITNSNLSSILFYD
jgi:plasmid replication initiation protein